MAALFKKIRNILFGYEDPSERRQQRRQRVPRFPRLAFDSDRSEETEQLMRPEPRDLNFRRSIQPINTPNWEDRNSEFGNKELVKMLNKARQSCRNLMNENQRLKDEIQANCEHLPGVHYICGNEFREGDIYRMNRAREAYMLPLSSEVIQIDRTDRASFISAQSRSIQSLEKLEEIERKLKDVERANPRHRAMSAMATQTAPIDNGSAQPESPQRAIREENNLFCNKDRVIHSVSTDIKRPRAKPRRSPYIPQIDPSQIQNREERHIRINTFHFNHFEEDQEPDTEPRGRRALNLGQFYPTKRQEPPKSINTRAKIESPRHQEIPDQDNKMERESVRPTQTQFEIATPKKEYSQAQQGSSEESEKQKSSLIRQQSFQSHSISDDLFLPGVWRQQSIQESEVSERPSQSSLDFSFISNFQPPPAQVQRAVQKDKETYQNSSSKFSSFLRNANIASQAKDSSQQRRSSLDSKEKLRKSYTLPESVSFGIPSLNRALGGFDLKEEKKVNELKQEEPIQSNEAQEICESSQIDFVNQSNEDNEIQKQENIDEQVPCQSEQESEISEVVIINKKEAEEKGQSQFLAPIFPQESTNCVDEFGSSIINQESSSGQYEGHIAEPQIIQEESQHSLSQKDEEDQHLNSQNNEKQEKSESEQGEKIEEPKEEEEEKKQPFQSPEEEEVQFYLDSESESQIDGSDREQGNFKIPRIIVKNESESAQKSIRSISQASARKRKNYYNPTPQVTTNLRESKIHGRGPSRNPSPPQIKTYNLRSRTGLKRVDYRKF